jgi:hypothetical protein
MAELASPVIGEAGPCEQARRRARERRQLAAIPAWFSVEDLIAAPWENGRAQFV